MIYRAGFIAILSTVLLSACGGGTPAESYTMTVPSESKILIGAGNSEVVTISTDNPVYVAFGFELDSGSYEAAKNCPEQNVGSEDEPFMMSLCAELRDANPNSAGNHYFQGSMGGGTMFEPENGAARVRVTNFAEHSMEFAISVDEKMN